MQDLQLGLVSGSVAFTCCNMLAAVQVSDLFDISEDDLFAGSSRRSLLAALLAEQQHAHWCTAIGCSPEPAFMTQLSAATAVNGKVSGKTAHQGLL